jgi:hypothetical protein
MEFTTEQHLQMAPDWSQIDERVAELTPVRVEVRIAEAPAIVPDLPGHQRRTWWIAGRRPRIFDP